MAQLASLPEGAARQPLVLSFSLSQFRWQKYVR